MTKIAYFNHDRHPPQRSLHMEEKTWKIFIRDLITQASIGIHDHEKLAKQTIQINLECHICMPRPIDDIIDSTQYVCYDQIIQSIQQLLTRKHFNLVESLAEEIADLCFQDNRIQHLLVRVEKRDVYQDVASVGVEIERMKSRDGENY